MTVDNFKFKQKASVIQEILDKAAALPDAEQLAGQVSKMQAVTYAELKALRDGGELVPGMWYRITDYVTMINEYVTESTGQVTPTHMKSAGHPFDVIVMAISTSEISQDARAIQHEGDEYFANSDLNSWQIRYRFTDLSKHFFDFLYPEDNKGVITWMRDEYGNECPYDFKNLLFERHAMLDTSLPSFVSDIALDAQKEAVQGLLSLMQGNMSTHFGDMWKYVCYGGYVSEAELASSDVTYTENGEPVVFNPSGGRMFVKINRRGDYLKEVDPTPTWLYTFMTFSLYTGDASLNSAGELDQLCNDNHVDGSNVVLSEFCSHNKISGNDATIEGSNHNEVACSYSVLKASYFKSGSFEDSVILTSSNSEIKKTQNFYAYRVDNSIVAFLQNKYVNTLTNYVGATGE